MTHRFSLAALLSTALVTTACQVEKAPENETDSTIVANTPDASTETPSGGAMPAPVASSEPVQATPQAEAPVLPTPAADKQPAAAVAVLQAYCDAIAHKDYRTAYNQWSDSGRASGLTYAQFVDAYRNYDAFDCSFSAPLDEEGAAGSIYLTVPAVITGTLAKGGGFTLRGPFTMRRVNDVDGSTAEQRRWHIAESALKPRP